MQDDHITGDGKGIQDDDFRDKRIAEDNEEMRLAAEREILLNRRRSQQSGKPRRRKVVNVLSLVFIGGAALLFVIVAGPTGALRILGVTENSDGPRASKVDMEVDNKQDSRPHLDFIVPAPPEPSKEKLVDPNLAWTQRFQELQEKLLEMERNKQPELSASEVRQMLNSYNETVTRRLEEERKAMAVENDRLREEAHRMEDQRRRSEEDAKLWAARTKEKQEIDKAQRESDSVIVDDSSNLGALANGANGPIGDVNEDLDGNERFLKSSSLSSFQTSFSQKLADPSRMVVQGTIISAVLETAIDTQLPGSIRAQVMQPVFSFDGSRVVMPPGTTLIGQFNNDVDIAQKRVLIAWNRAITPDGKSISIGSIGTDRLGRSGTLGNVDNRYGTKFGAATLISAINAIPALLSSQVGGRESGRSGSASSGTTVNIGGQMAGSAGGRLSEQTSGILEKYLSLPPVLRIPQGEEIRVFVNKDLFFR